jgi:hypothetical protein
MHPLLSRMLIRGPIIFLTVAGLSWLMGYLALNLIEGLERGSSEGTLWSMTKFGLFGLALYVVLEWISYAREKNKKLPTEPTVP